MATDLLHHHSALDRHRSQRYGSAMIERVAKLESDVEYIKRDVAEMKADVRALREENRSEFRDVRARQERDFRLLFGTVVSLAVGLAGLMAKGFHWF